MIVVMKPGCTNAQVEHVAVLLRELGLKDHVIVGTDRTVVAAIGDKREVDISAVENAPMVDRLVPILAPYKVASREVKQDRSVIPLGSAGHIGGTKIGIIAGPCSVENEKQLMSCAQSVAKAGAIGLRGGAFKPRTNPYSFQGLGEAGLQLLAKARDETGLAVVTEVMSIDQVDRVAYSTASCATPTSSPSRASQCARARLCPRTTSSALSDTRCPARSPDIASSNTTIRS